jgi:outer membrane protein assembly factor BamB
VSATPDERIAIPTSEDTLLATNLSDVGSGLGILSRLRPDGSEVWSVQAPGGTGDFFTSVSFEGDVVVTYSWAGFVMRTDLETGAVIERTFTK